MLGIPNRSPIDYDDLRRPYNGVRGIGASLFVLSVIVWAVATGNPETLVVAIPALFIAFDALHRAVTPTSGPLGGILIDATIIGVVLVLHGPEAGMNGIAVMTILVTSALLLPIVQVIAVVGYMAALSIAMVLFEDMGVPFVGIMGEESEHIVLDAAIVAIFILSIATVLYLAVRVILAAQDREREALDQARRAIELKNEFVSMVSHELRTPLTGIAGFTETLNERWHQLPARDVDEFLTIMGHETEHLSNLVEDILVIPRLEAGQLRLDIQDLELGPEIHTVSSMTFDMSSYAITVPAGVVVSADRTRLRQILRNLLENARKYGGEDILIEGELHSDGLYAVSVSDNGPGVSPEDRERIFEHFEQLSTGDAREQQGVGLGLPIARKLAKAMGGDLWYEDRFPVGSKFRFTVPLAAVAAEQRRSAPEARVG